MEKLLITWGAKGDNLSRAFLFSNLGCGQSRAAAAGPPEMTRIRRLTTSYPQPMLTDCAQHFVAFCLASTSPWGTRRPLPPGLGQ